jgi:flavin-dependent dehydrogenase
MNKVVIIGNGIVGNLTALYLSKKIPELEITLIGRTDRQRALVGESTVELSTHFFEALGLGKLLEDKHYHKYGLTYYYKSKKDPSCRDYVVHEAPGIIRLPAYNLNRFTFDKELRRIVSNRPIEVIEGTVKNVTFKDDNSKTHRIEIKSPDGTTSSSEADWVIDASGANRFLVKKLKLHQAPAYQRSSFWFRLKEFDRDILNNINAMKIEHHCYDPYYVTHHFYGQAYWIWMIPMRSETGESMMSIGYTYRPELGSETVKNLDDFLRVVEKDHPVITDLVRSGTLCKAGNIDDTTLYRNYMYEAKQYYSKDGWFLVGDSAFLFDPINSLGLSYVSHMVCQIAAMIAKDKQGELTQSYIDCHEKHIQAILSLQDSWGKWYEFMGDPVKLSWTLLTNNMAYFNVLLPAFMNGGFLDGRHIDMFTQFFKRLPVEQQGVSYPYAKLLDLLSEQATKIDLNILPNLYAANVPFELYRADEKLRKKLFIRYLLRTVSIRTELMKRIQWKLEKRYLSLFFMSLAESVSDLFKIIVVKCASNDMIEYHDIKNPDASPFGKGGNFLEFKGE